MAEVSFTLVAESPKEAARQDVFLAPHLERALRALKPPSDLIRAARARVHYGPLYDALSCLPIAGDGEWLLDPQYEATTGRLMLLLWEAGGAGVSIPRLGPWLFQNKFAFRELITKARKGPLFNRVIAARLLEIAADGFPSEAQMQIAVRTVHAAAELARHPEPLVYIPAVRALGRLAGHTSDARMLISRWQDSPHPGERRRAITALACLPDREEGWLASRLTALFEERGDPWAQASIGPAIPYLARDRRGLWTKWARHLRDEKLGPEVLFSVVQGLLILAKGDALDRTGRELLQDIRQRALDASTRSTISAQLWLGIRRQTDFLDHIDPDPDDLELLFDRTISSSVSAPPERLVPRAIALSGRLGAVFEAAAEKAVRSGSPSDHANALATLESCARAATLDLWQPVLQASGADTTPLREESLQNRNRMLEVIGHILEHDAPDYPLHRTALRVLGLLADARNPTVPEDAAPGARRIIGWVESSEDLKAPTKRQASRFRKPVGDILYRLFDRTRSAELPLPEPLRYVRFAAWWAFAAESTAILGFLGRSEAAASHALDETTMAAVEEIKRALAAENAPHDGQWIEPVARTLDTLNALETSLGRAVITLGEALTVVHQHRRSRSVDLRTEALIRLATAITHLELLMDAPEHALSPSDVTMPTSTLRTLRPPHLEKELSPEQKERLPTEWSRALGPVLGPVVSEALRKFLALRSPGSFPKSQPRTVGQYRLIEQLGAGAQGEAWLVEHNRSERRFVMKLLAAHAQTTPVGRALHDALELEADLLKRIYHPHVARFIDRGLEGDRPYLVLEYLLGCDLEQYARTRLMTPTELVPVVEDVSSGLSALRDFNLVHCDLKPGNIFLQLDLPHEDPVFRPERDRDSSVSPILTAVVIDFGIARSMAQQSAQSAASMSGTLGFIAPEQARGQIHTRTDVYALAGTIYRALTGKSFFEHLPNPAAMLVAHAAENPFDHPEAAEVLPASAPSGLIELLKEATAMDPTSRPDIRTFSERFRKAVTGR